ncbi:ATP-binding protein [Porphyromonas levii]|uniref:ATP-binding protein n=1 Tax=Porphyromonas levii TaxID=28114 RepID=UPI001B8D5C6A|nr:ATP-binding protein [Porphyromonas levii]MBR8769882.1 hypothetical protein [Porphyromonas levii]
MNNKSINRVSIALRPNVYSTFRNLNNTISNTLGEYVDNAVQSYIDHKEILMSYDPQYKLNININIDWERGRITIMDNAAGIDSDNYLRAFEPAHIPIDDTGLNEFGMGMKTASVWLANNWSVSTKAIGEEVERYTEFDLQKVTDEQKEELIVKETNAPQDEHYTCITLTKLSSNAPKPGQIDKIRRHLSSIYRHFLRNEDINIIVNGVELEAPNYGILCAPYYKFPKEDHLWIREIDFTMGAYKAKGFIAILDKIKNGASGLVLMRRGRVIVGGDDERYFPSVIFGQPGSFRYRRLFGELELEGFEVTFNKNGIREEDDLYLFMEALRDELKADEYSILSQADNYRQRGKEHFSKISKEIKRGLEKKNKPKQLSRQISEVESKLNNLSYIQNNEDKIRNATPLEHFNEIFEYNGKSYTLLIELVTESDSDSLYSVEIDDSSQGATDDSISISCRINLAHAFFTRFDQFKKGRDYEPIVAIFKALTLAEIMAPNMGTKLGFNIRTLFNQNILQ